MSLSPNSMEKLEKLWRDSFQSLVIAAAATAQHNATIATTCLADSASCPSSSYMPSFSQVSHGGGDAFPAASGSQVSHLVESSPSPCPPCITEAPAAECPNSTTASVLCAFITNLVAGIPPQPAAKSLSKRKRKRRRRPQLHSKVQATAACKDTLPPILELETSAPSCPM